MFDKLQKYAPAALLVLALPFNAEAAEPGKCNVSLTVQPGAKETQDYWSGIKSIRQETQAQNITLPVLVFPTSGESSAYIVMDGNRKADYPLADLKLASHDAMKMQKDCLEGQTPVAIPVSQP